MASLKQSRGNGFFKLCNEVSRKAAYIFNLNS